MPKSRVIHRPQRALEEGEERARDARREGGDDEGDPLDAHHVDADRLGAQRLGVDPADCLVCEDAPSGITAARAARCAVLAQEAGYDAVEIMGSEGYLLNQFLAQRTNQRDDEWGGDAQRRRRFPVEVVRAVRAAAPGLPIIYRISLMDLVDGGQAWEDVVALAQHDIGNAVATLVVARWEGELDTDRLHAVLGGHERGEAKPQPEAIAVPAE